MEEMVPQLIEGDGDLASDLLTVHLESGKLIRSLGDTVWSNLYKNRMPHDPACEPFWSAAKEYDFSIGSHEGGSSGMPMVGIDRFDGRAAKHIISHTMEMMLACLSMFWGGGVERHPKLRVAFLESGGGWVAPWLERMDRHFDDQGFNDLGLKTRPSDLFRRNCWISFEPVEGSLKVLAEYIGPHKILWRPTIRTATASFRGRRR
jgi:hypothetical protein